LQGFECEVAEVFVHPRWPSFEVADHDLHHLPVRHPAGNVDAQDSPEVFQVWVQLVVVRVGRQSNQDGVSHLSGPLNEPHAEASVKRVNRFSSMRLRQPGRTLFALLTCADAAVTVNASTTPNNNREMRIDM
jgi:hypothetical protein